MSHATPQGVSRALSRSGFARAPKRGGVGFVARGVSPGWVFVAWRGDARAVALRGMTRVLSARGLSVDRDPAAPDLLRVRTVDPEGKVVIPPGTGARGSYGRRRAARTLEEASPGAQDAMAALREGVRSGSSSLAPPASS